jgi:ABC-type xylose transport system permease subunit
MVLAVGMTFVLIIGGIDLSVGSVLALAASTVSVAILGWGWSVLPPRCSAWRRRAGRDDHRFDHRGVADSVVHRVARRAGNGPWRGVPDDRLAHRLHR